MSPLTQAAMDWALDELLQEHDPGPMIKSFNQSSSEADYIDQLHSMLTSAECQLISADKSSSDDPLDDLLPVLSPPEGYRDSDEEELEAEDRSMTRSYYPEPLATSCPHPQLQGQS